MHAKSKLDIEKREKPQKPRTLTVKQLTRERRKARREALAVLPDEVTDLETSRPKTRADCIDVERPCPYVGCRYNLYLDSNPVTGSIKLNFPDKGPDEMPADASCALDIADGTRGLHLEEIGERMNLTRERVRQIEVQALFKLKETTPDDLCGAEEDNSSEHDPFLYNYETL
ncbi:DNA-binding protein [Candidatus Peregrinibacteria bacterium CG11_big_fil_rev_8_21_14_0_20_46_8]|nr:MAG: DNA-binding protein [Candidatus Peregrinibacteria bacterium CG11_big_fil_rev_8_21_14_0_20_46_8]